MFLNKLFFTILLFTFNYTCAQVSRKVLLEEFTGTWSNNAVAANDSINKIDSLFPNKCIVASNHNADSLVIPFNTLLEQALQVQGYPRACIDRDTFYGANFFAMSRWYWIDAVAEKLNVSSPVAIKMNTSYSPGNRVLIVNVDYKFFTQVNENTRLTCLLLEDSIKVNQAGFGPNYNLNNVVKMNLSANTWGDSNNPELVNIGDSFFKSYSVIVPSNINDNNIKVISFLSKKNNPSPTLGFGTAVLNTEVQKITKLVSNNNDFAVGKFYVGDAYPNPSNDITSLDFELPTTSHVNAFIINQQGQMIKPLINEKRIKGKHSIYWAGTNQQTIRQVAGFYFLVLYIDKQKIVRKIVLE